MTLKIIIHLSFWISCLSNCSVAWSQSSPRGGEGYISYGIYSVPRLLKGLGSVLVPVLASPYADINEIQLAGSQSIGLGYNYQLNSKYKIGGHFLYENFSETITFSDGQRNRYRTNAYTFLGRFYQNWINNDMGLKLYTSLSLGVGVLIDSDETNPNTIFAFHINPVGVQYGKHWSAFVELGLGWQGLLAAGITRQF